MGLIIPSCGFNSRLRPPTTHVLASWDCYVRGLLICLSWQAPSSNLVRTAHFHCANMGSNPIGVTYCFKGWSPSSYGDALLMRCAFGVRGCKSLPALNIFVRFYRAHSLMVERVAHDDFMLVQVRLSSSSGFGGSTITGNGLVLKTIICGFNSYLPLVVLLSLFFCFFL